ncbi:hypothetical protein LTR95_003394 [Oleoguttula sp. CCFEE 5521]
MQPVPKYFTAVRVSQRDPSTRTKGRLDAGAAQSASGTKRATESQGTDRRPQRVEHTDGTRLSEAASSTSPGTWPNIQGLAFILHPSHEACSPKDRRPQPPISDVPWQPESRLAQSCYALGVDPRLLGKLGTADYGRLAKYFETFTSFQLFRKPDLALELHRIQSQSQDDLPTTDTDGNPYLALPSSLDLSQHARQSLEAAISECDDEALPMCVLQAMVLVTHWLLIQGVRGRAWRYLGNCVRTAYELNLHLVDIGKTQGQSTIDAAEWAESEGRRRVWWAIWEMDVFASIIRRCPVGIDWSQNETLLPAEDERWNRDEPQMSCLLDSNASSRWRSLAAAGNRSPKAWFIVANSYVKDAQRITSPIGLDNSGYARGLENATDRLKVLLNNVHCTSVGMPDELKFRNQQLHFGRRESDPTKAEADSLQHAAIFSIHCMIQLSRMMTYRYWIFKKPSITVTSPRAQIECAGATFGDSRPLFSPRPESSSVAATLALDQYFESADEIHALLRRSCGDHYKYVNPYLANTVWLAGAVQLFYKSLASTTESGRERILSNFQLLNMTYNQYLQHWNMSTTLQKTLEAVEKEFRSFGSGPRSRAEEAASSESSPPAGHAQRDSGGYQGGEIAQQSRSLYKDKQTLPPLDAGVHDPPGGYSARKAYGSSASDQLTAGVAWSWDEYDQASLAARPSQSRVECALWTPYSAAPTFPISEKPYRSARAGTAGVLDVQRSSGHSLEPLVSDQQPGMIDLDYFLSPPPNPGLAAYLDDMLSGSYMNL